MLTLSVIIALAGGWFYGLRPSHVNSIVDLELAGSASAARLLVKLSARSAYRAALHRDFAFIFGYAIALVSACFMGMRLFLSRSARRVAWYGLLATSAAALCDVVENFFLLSVLGGRGRLHLAGDTPYRLAATFATAKWALLLFAAPVAIVAFLVAIKRGFAASRRDLPMFRAMKPYLRPPWPVVHSDASVSPPLTTSTPRRHDQASPRSNPPAISNPISWTIHYFRGRHVQSEPKPVPDHYRYAAMVPKGREHAEVGFCVSGGGIRSASFALGALQSLRGPLRRARYLVAVSGLRQTL